eukprot:1149969-Pelagomonas_calceolata.AAC.8
MFTLYTPQLREMLPCMKGYAECKIFLSSERGTTPQLVEEAHLCLAVGAACLQRAHPFPLSHLGPILATLLIMIRT